MKLKLPHNLRLQLKKVEDFFDKNYPNTKLYIVGGAVRDMIMQRPVCDLDIECFGISPKSFDEAMGRLGAKGVGRSFFVYKYGDIDISLPRTERKTAKGHRGFTVYVTKSTKEASRRRDFTMNALMYDLENETVIDHWGGLEDIEKRVIRVVDPKSFVEDSLRVLRAMQFSARLKFRVEKKSRDLMCRMNLDDISEERIFWEFEKMFKAPFLHYGLFTMIDLCIAKKILKLEIRREHFFVLAIRMIRARRVENQKMREYYFLYILTCTLHLDKEKTCDKIHTPNIYKKILKSQKCVPKKFTDRFLGALALRFCLRDWLGVYADKAVSRAKKLGIYSHRFDPGVRSEDLIKEGYSGKELGLELRKRVLNKIKKHFSKEKS